jgi:protein-tyrosine phosphatase
VLQLAGTHREQAQSKQASWGTRLCCHCRAGGARSGSTMATTLVKRSGGGSSWERAIREEELG